MTDKVDYATCDRVRPGLCSTDGIYSCLRSQVEEDIQPDWAIIFAYCSRHVSGRLLHPVFCHTDEFGE